jgi:hypothetical protein
VVITLSIIINCFIGIFVGSGAIVGVSMRYMCPHHLLFAVAAGPPLLDEERLAEEGSLSAAEIAEDTRLVTVDELDEISEDL